MMPAKIPVTPSLRSRGGGAGARRSPRDLSWDLQPPQNQLGMAAILVTYLWRLRQEP